MIRFYIILLAIVILFIFFGNLIYTVSPYDLNPSMILTSPSSDHLFGTDRLGRDVWSEI